ncbi:alpha/beta hydrolase [Micromonospora auratinigra]|uniref:Putative esterase n=1 Tax=Micromonospora auratinigra TaxID=261654 RepID=A0A1A8ZC49_9ACTN|nr:alpha/beta hydrolase-fold protein [Micromonospora auratinigra]SBT41374.1 Putative esterase [Micromonospora auratinigra]
MSPDSLPAELTAAALAVAAATLLAACWDTRTGWQRHTVRAGTALLCLATTALAGLSWANRQSATYTTWSDLLGHPDTATSAVAAGTGDGHHGRVVTVTVPGTASGLNLPMYVYLPAAYDTHPDQRFPVIETLHGYPGSPAGWLQSLDAPAHLDREITAGRMAPTVVLFPYQTPDTMLDTECLDLVHGPHAETFLTTDVPAWATTHLRVRADRNAWGLTGLSAGGYCATNLLLKHPDRYAAAASLSGYADPGITVGDGSEHTVNDDLWRLRHLPRPAVALYLSCGRTDHHALRDTRALSHLAGAPITLTTSYIDGGGHNPATWRAVEATAFDWLSTWLSRPRTDLTPTRPPAAPPAPRSGTTSPPSSDRPHRPGG